MSGQNDKQYSSVMCSHDILPNSFKTIHTCLPIRHPSQEMVQEAGDDHCPAMAGSNLGDHTDRIALQVVAFRASQGVELQSEKSNEAY